MEENILLLAPYSPLIQLLAGIYLLFLYESFFLKNPLTQQQTEINSSLIKFTNQYQGNLTKGQTKTAIKRIVSHNERWNNFSTTIKRIYLLSFLFCVFLLIYVGSESIEKYRSYHYALQIMDSGVLIYSIFLWSLYQWKHVLKKFVSVIIIFFFLVFLFHHFEYINKFCFSHNIILTDNMTTSHISILSIILCFTGIIISTIHIILSYIRIVLTRRRIGQLSKNTGYWVDILMKRKEIKDLPKRFQKKCSHWLINQNLSNEGLNNFLEEEVNKEFKRFIRQMPLQRRKRRVLKILFYRVIYKLPNKFFRIIDFLGI